MHRMTPMALILSCFAAASAHGQEERYYSFTSGGAPTGDGFNWPKSQIAKQGTVGLNGAGFVTPDSPLTLLNFSGNPAYFNSNNLLTRPASLISRDAWWTDPRWANYSIGGTSYQSAGLSIQFQQADWGHTEVYDFGFDMAFASVSHELPLFLDYQIADTLGNIGFGYLSFAGTPPNDQGYSRSNYSTFNTLGSVYGGKQARFRFNVEDLLANVLDNPPGEDDDTGEYGFYGLEFIDIRLRPLVTSGGTSQIAIDNFVINGAQVGAPPPEPTYIAPNFPLPETTIYRVDYTDDTNDDYVDVSGDDLAAVSITSGTSAQPFSSNTVNTSTTVVFDPNAGEAGQFVQSHELSHSALNSPPDADGRVQVSAVTILANMVGVDSPPPYGLEINSQLTPGITPDSVLRQALQEEQLILQTLSEITEARHRATMEVIQNIRSSSAMALSDDITFSLSEISSESSTDPGFEYYVNYSLLEYIDRKAAQGEEWNVGDQGYTLRQVLVGEDEDIETFILTTWLITDESGTFVQTMAVPEPSSLALLSLGGLLIARRRR